MGYNGNYSGQALNTINPSQRDDVIIPAGGWTGKSLPLACGSADLMMSFSSVSPAIRSRQSRIMDDSLPHGTCEMPFAFDGHV